MYSRSHLVKNIYNTISWFHSHPHNFHLIILSSPLISQTSPNKQGVWPCCRTMKKMAFGTVDQALTEDTSWVVTMNSTASEKYEHSSWQWVRPFQTNLGAFAAAAPCHRGVGHEPPWPSLSALRGPAGLSGRSTPSVADSCHATLVSSTEYAYAVLRDVGWLMWPWAHLGRAWTRAALTVTVVASSPQA